MDNAEPAETRLVENDRRDDGFKTNPVRPPPQNIPTQMAIFRKMFATPKRLKNELKLHKRSASHGLSPKVLATDNQTFIDYVHLNEMNVHDMFGDKIPPNVMAAIWGVLHTLYYVYNIEYLDVWPRNFIWKDGRIWVIDFEDAKLVDNDSPTPYTKQRFETGKIDHWAPDFA